MQVVNFLCGSMSLILGSLGASVQIQEPGTQTESKKTPKSNALSYPT